MEEAGRSLRTMVQYWLSSESERGFRVSHFGRSHIGRYVCVVADDSAGSKAMFFYRHRGGNWCIFPPAPDRPAMRVVDFRQ